MGSDNRQVGFQRREGDGLPSTPFFAATWDPVSHQHESLGGTSLNSQATFPLSHFSDAVQNHGSSNLGHYSPDPGFLHLPKLPHFGSGGLAELIGPYAHGDFDHGVHDNGSERSKENAVASPQFSGETLVACSRRRKRNAEAPTTNDSALDEKKSRNEGQACVDSPCKQNSQGTEPRKDSYIHVRARRGQATNSHSLAERVRREKISERMKTLQELVPGCNKITGKAVMLDEIINYVQSLQQQVEFLSMKLATVNPEINLDIEKILSKDLAYSRGLIPGMSSSSHSTGLLRGSIPLLPQGNLLFPAMSQQVFEADLQSFLQPGFDSSSGMNSLASNAAGKLKPEV